MERLAFLALAGCIFLLSFPCAVRADLAEQIEQVRRDKLLDHASVGIDIVHLGRDADNVTPLYQSNATVPLIPASNLKVVTTSAALEQLGADFKFRTKLLYHDGDLILIGDGDPSLGDAELLKKAGWDVNTVFKIWADGLVKKNFPPARNVLVDDSVFDQQFIHPNWPADQTDMRYAAEIAGINLNANCLDLFVNPGPAGEIVPFTTDPATLYVTIKNSCVSGDRNAVWFSRAPGGNELTLRGQASSANTVPISLTIHDPPLYAGTVLSETFKSAGIHISGTVQRDRTAAAAYLKAQRDGDKSWVLLAVHETPLSTVIDRANKDSMNLYAECLCKRLGFDRFGEGSWKTGTAAVGQFLGSLKIPPSQYSLDDGCGLSKYNAVSPHLMVSVLTYDYFSRNSDVWLGSLAVAGEDGTLLDRFRASDLRGRVIAKTGFVNGVSCLSGYLRARDNEWYCFSIMFNGIPEGSNSTAKILEERIVRLIDQHTTAIVQTGAN
jgi:serine-type D-Ala-D-Ala carboxypeptidase/endopeptidase (penicillin-binding protein 4)